MKIFGALICLFGSAFVAIGQNGLLWSAPAPVSSSDYGYYSPRLALLSDGNPAVAWGGGNDIYFSRMLNDTFTSPVLLPNGNTTPLAFDFGGLDLAAAGSTLYVVFETAQSGIQVVRSLDAGASWQDPVSAYTPALGKFATISSITVDPAGNPMISFLLENSNESNAVVWLTRSLDGGVTWQAGAEASAPAMDDYVCECCYQDILPISEDTIFVAFRSNRNNLRDMWVSRSSNGGISFDDACDADAQDWVVNACPFSGPKMARLGSDSLLMVWMSKPGTALRVFGSTLHQETMQKGWEFGFPGSAGVNLFNQNHPDVAAHGDTLAIVWEETGFSGTGQEIVCAFSTTGTAGLPINLANISNIPGTQRFPQIAYRQGALHVVYADSQNGVSYQTSTVIPSSGVGQAPAIKAFSVVPNPTSGRIKVISNQTPGTILLYHPNGHLLRTAENTDELSIGDLPNGLYFIGYYGQVQKLIKSN